MLGAAAVWVWLHPERGSLGAALAVVAAVAVFGGWLQRFGTVRWPVGRASGVNLEATRGVPRVWLIAHLDSKSQPIPLLMRAGGVVSSLVAWGTLFAVWAASSRFRVPAVAIMLPAAAAVAGTVPLAWSFVSARSAGALDNGSGVVAVLRAAESLARDLPLGVLLTSAEELGLAGARAWVMARPSGVALNCDGVDDVGRVSVTVARDRHGELVAAVQGARHALRAPVPFVVRRAVPGVLLDAAAFADAGWIAATVSRGGWRSLARVHTAADERARLRGDGVDGVARLLAGIAGAMITA
ncbi:MAG TPA: M28 family peptidase [Candidatus Elarobacter sp.]|nr:M28 family peptidase [Candidatus Elarobacter sp.]